MCPRSGFNKKCGTGGAGNILATRTIKEAKAKRDKAGKKVKDGSLLSFLQPRAMLVPAIVHAEPVQQIAAIEEPTTRHQVVGKGERRRVDDIIFPKIDACLITLAGWFPTKNNFGIQSFTQIAAPP